MGTERKNSTKQKWVLITPDDNADILFFKGVSDHDASGFQHAITTEYMAEAVVLEYTEEQMQFILDKMYAVARFTAVPVKDVDIFKAKLAGV